MLERETARAIIEEADNTRAALARMDRQIQEQIDEIVLQAAREGRPISDAEKEQRRSLRADQVELQDAFKELAFVTLQRLDQSADIAELKDRLTSVNNDLQDDLRRLRNIERYAEIAAKVADGLTELAAKVADAATPG